jgi:hypothetical protein
MKILVTGDRNWNDRPTMYTILDGMPITSIVEGCARGADRMAEEWAALRKIPVQHFPAKWDLYGKSAGPRRNAEMLTTKPDLVIAFHKHIEESRGTRDMIKQAERKGIDVHLISTL